ncbi:putative DNA repair helicase and transcription factor protein [Trypanosoma vivax]|nr:putative DNA repair helicase and transcription factor protein [Trypanosoma vivax]
MSEYVISPSSLSAASAEGTYSVAMIRNVVRYFRLDAKFRLPVDIVKYVELQQRVQDGSQDASLGILGDEDRVTNGATLENGGTCHSEPAVKKLKKEDEEFVPEVKVNSLENTEKPRRRFLSLVRKPPAPLEPLVARTLVNPDALLPLPDDLEQMLQDEERSSKVRIVLQRRLQGRQRCSSSQAHNYQKQNESSEEEALAYFLVSHDRQHMEFLVEHLREYIVPVSLYGALRWVISDIDRGVEERSVVEDGRARTLRILFDTPSGQKSELQSANSSRMARSEKKYTRIVYKSQVMKGRLRNVRERLFKQLGVRVDLSYDYNEDCTLHVCDLELAGHARLRPYQVASLERFRSGNKAHQGIIVLPCGAGKTLTGIGAATIVKKRTIVMCINVMSVLQWQQEFVRWTNLTEDQVTVCISDKKQMPGDVFITTYSMLIARRTSNLGQEQGEDAKLTSKILFAVEEQPWGLLLLDEVHTALAQNFQEVLNKVKYKCVVGLSATLLREDGRIDDLRHLVGPKLYEANWLDLTNAGFLARVECAEVQCPLPISFFSEYLIAQQEEDPSARRGTSSLARALVCLNPYKLWCTQALLEFHRNRSPPDKVIIFCDDVEGVQYYAQHLHVPFMDGKTSDSERANVLQHFKNSSKTNAIILSRIGDVALDIPCASVVIQISGLGASRRQEAQRLGRILRPKPPSLDSSCSYFYTLVSQDTYEMSQSYERQSWLRDQGFSYRVLQCETVFGHLLRTGGKPCCVGAPRWWYESDRAADSAAISWKGSYWLPFSPEAARCIQRRFIDGSASCELDGSVLVGTPRPEGLGGSSLEDSWTVRFSDSNAPETFGIVQFVKEKPLFVRRVCCGPIGTDHNCLKEECLQHALQHAKSVATKRSTR